MKTITFTSHYNKTKLNVRLSDDNADKLFNNKYYSALELYQKDSENVSYMQNTKIFSFGQIKKIDNYLPGIDYWESVEMSNIK